MIMKGRGKGSKVQRSERCRRERGLIIKMRKQLEYKLCEFRDKRIFAETKQRKELVDNEAITYLAKRCPLTVDFIEAHKYYQEITSR